MKHCQDCDCEVEGILYNDMVNPNIFICEECGQFIKNPPTLEEKNLIDNIANFCAWLVDNHECRFSGGEVEIAELCSAYVEQLNKKEASNAVTHKESVR